MKNKLLALILLLVFPCVVFATETEFKSTIWDVEDYDDAKTLCESAAEEGNRLNTNNNGEIQKYVQCVEIKCENSKIKHSTLKPFSDTITCSNGNSNPYATVSDSGVTETDTDLIEGAACTANGTAVAYATEVISYKCGKTYNSNNEPVDFVTPEDTPEDTPTEKDDSEGGNSDEGKQSSDEGKQSSDEGKTSNNDPAKVTDTGVSDYYIALAGIAAVLGVGLYVLNKKNVFKKI